ncbi:hypothetical protein CXB51_027215 [Gossypium anomalum]|uniref:Uncharacterized protein n=1 Tax=Gossypium anomalum TaxID=47600 RepID=A0A8J5YEK7_9ROSI|nr:hypothetical protein CXB51_027215 [Gossypium anomalum]
MAVDHPTTPKPSLPTHISTPFLWQQARRRLFFLRRRNHKVPTVRLGGKKPRRGSILIVKILKKIRWVKLQYRCMLRKLRKQYRNLIKDMVEAGANIEALQQRMFMESTFALPVMGVSFSTFPSASASDRPKTLLF